MNDLIYSNAMATLWCEPYSEADHTIKLNRYSNSLGVRGLTFNYSHRTYLLPTTNDKYHLFHLTDMNIYALGLNLKNKIWYNVEELINSEGLMVEVFTESGIVIPKSLVEIMRIENTLVLAFKYDATFKVVLTSNMFIRTYENRLPTIDEGLTSVIVRSNVLTSINQIVSIQNLLAGYSNSDIRITCFKNGYKVSGVSPVIFSIGDWIEYRYTPVTDKKILHKVDDLRSFTSIVDNSNKYIFTGIYNDLEINHIRDLNIYLVRGDGYGVKLRNDKLRMITNQDYSIPIEYIDTVLMMNESTFVNQDDIYILISINNSTSRRAIVNTSLQLITLGRLSESSRLNVLSGVDSSVSAWTAAKLEASAHMRLLNSKYEDVTDELILETYGYDSIISNLVPSLLHGSDAGNANYWTFNIKNTQVNDSVIHTYDADGLHTGILSDHVGSDILSYTLPKTESNNLHELYVGDISEVETIIVNANNITLNPKFNYRVYRKLKSLSNDTNWEDITDVGNICFFTETNLEIVLDFSLYDVIVRDDSTRIYKELELDTYNNVYVLNVAGLYIDRDTNEYIDMDEIPPGSVDIFMNGHYLVPGIDMQLEYPMCYISTREYVDNGKVNQSFHIRHSGFCTDELKLEPLYETGYVLNGFISNDGQFDIHGDKPYTLFIGGKIESVDDITFKENSLGIVSSPAEGKPYALLRTLLNFKPALGVDPYAIRDTSDLQQAEISDYLTTELDDVDTSDYSNVSDYQSHYSILMSRLIFAYEEGERDINEIKGRIDNDVVRTIVGAYSKFLDMDPCVLYPDSGYVKVVPMAGNYPRPLNIHIYQLLVKVNQMYLGSKVQINSFFTVTY